MQRWGEPPFLQQCAGAPVDKAKGGRHGRQVEFYARQVRPRGDAAVGDDEGFAVGEQRDFVRADAVGLQLADAPVVVRRVVDADDAAFPVEIVSELPRIRSSQ